VPTAPVPPRRVGVVGAGMAGLCTAWFLQEQGIGVTVLERTAVAAGASAGNAGWITPALVAPLPDPVILREGLRAVMSRSAAVYLPRLPGPGLPAGPVYLPAQRLACTPLPGGRLRVAGVMEFRPAGAALDHGRVARIADGLPALLAGVDPGARQDEWVSARPCTPDGLPVIGRTRSARIFVAGGHGMWGITLGPVTGRLLAGLVTGRPAPELRPFDPLR